MCNWLLVGKKETCSEYGEPWCIDHFHKRLNAPKPCLVCGVGTKNKIQLCCLHSLMGKQKRDKIEKTSKVRHKRVMKQLLQHFTDAERRGCRWLMTGSTQYCNKPFANKNEKEYCAMHKHRIKNGRPIQLSCPICKKGTFAASGTCTKCSSPIEKV